MFVFAKKTLGKKSTRDKTLIKLLKSPAIMTSGISIIFPPEKYNELCSRLKLIIQAKETRKNFDLPFEKNVAMADKLLEYKYIYTKQHSFLIFECLN